MSSVSCAWVRIQDSGDRPILSRTASACACALGCAGLGRAGACEVREGPRAGRSRNRRSRHWQGRHAPSKSQTPREAGGRRSRPSRPVSRCSLVRPSLPLRLQGDWSSKRYDLLLLVGRTHRTSHHCPRAACPLCSASNCWSRNMLIYLRCSHSPSTR